MALAIILAGCQQAERVDDHLNDYAKRLVNVLEAEQVKFETVSLAPYPASNTLKQNIPLTTIKLSDFYGLKHCELYSLVAERNTALGRLQLPSTRYVYERKLLLALQTCIAETPDEQLNLKLNKWLTIKRKQLPAVWANLMQTSEETKHALATNIGVINGSSSDGLNQTKAALNYLIQLPNNSIDNSSELESHLKQLIDNPLPAKVWRTQLLLKQHLNLLTNWLITQESHLGCTATNKSKKLEYLTNVFRLFFIEKIQPIAGQLNHYHYQLTPMFEELIKTPHLSPSFKQYLHAQNTVGFEGYSNAMTEHLDFWQALFKGCNISPKQI